MISFHYLSRLIQISISSVINNPELNFKYVLREWFVQSMTVICRNYDFHSFIFDNLSFILFISDTPNEHIRIIRISEFWYFFFRWYAWIDMEEKVKSWNYWRNANEYSRYFNFQSRTVKESPKIWIYVFILCLTMFNYEVR